MADSLVAVTALELEAAAQDVLGDAATRFIRFLVLASGQKGDMTLDVILANALGITSALQQRIFIQNLLRVAQAVITKEPPAPTPLRSA